MEQKSEEIGRWLSLISEEQAKLDRALDEVERRKGTLKKLRATVAGMRRRDKARKRAANKPKRESVRVAKDAMQQRLAEATGMRKAGLTYADIGAVWGISAGRAREICGRAKRIEDYRGFHGKTTTT